MAKWEAYMPIGACAKFVMESDEKPSFDEFIENADTEGSLCWQCSGDVETNFELDYESVSKWDEGDLDIKEAE